MAINISLNMEFIRCEDKSFREGVERAAQLGYRLVEPLVHNGRELLSEAGYFHSVSMDDDPLEIKELLAKNGLKASSLSAHTPLMRPEIAVPYLTRAIRFARTLGAGIINTDEGVRPEWVSLDDAFHVMKYTLSTVLRWAERYGVSIAIEPHQSITKTTAGLLRVATLVSSPMLKINYDTGNAWLGGEDPYEGLKACLPLVVHVHAKDISIQQSDTERGKVTGTPVGCACGDGVVDWSKVVGILKDAGYNGVLSVECGTPAQAARSLEHLTQVIAAAGS
ncbi:MAG: sugar phosphate isomerase/epimerase [Acidobacteria bacterium]|nr:sugar phosphate isomerase/epimerase [Acidobacteriota bacterium]